MGDPKLELLECAQGMKQLKHHSEVVFALADPYEKDLKKAWEFTRPEMQQTDDAEVGHLHERITKLLDSQYPEWRKKG